MNLPEERLRLGKVTPFGSAPIKLRTDITETSRMTDVARRVLEERSFFSKNDRDRLLAKLWLEDR